MRALEYIGGVVVGLIGGTLFYLSFPLLVLIEVVKGDKG